MQLVPEFKFFLSLDLGREHSRPQRPRSFWSASRIAILGADQKERGLWGREWVEKAF